MFENMEKHLNLALILALPFAGCSASQPESLVPDTPSSAPDYFCTWNIQGYIASYPNDAVAVAAIGRALGREYVTKEVPVAIEGKDWSAPVGIFGNFESLTICYPDAPSGKKLKVYAQDLAGETPVDITGEVTIESNCLKVPGKTISRVGLMNATEGDRSGLVIKVM